jgi:hypothetical protein
LIKHIIGTFEVVNTNKHHIYLQYSFVTPVTSLVVIKSDNTTQETNPLPISGTVSSWQKKKSKEEDLVNVIVVKYSKYEIIVSLTNMQ